MIKRSSEHSATTGFMHADPKLRNGAMPNVFIMKDGNLMFEKMSSLLGVSSKMIACRKFIAEMNSDKQCIMNACINVQIDH